MSYKSIKVTIYFLVLFTLVTRAQKNEIDKQIEFSGSINLTNNGFSFIPIFSLGKPATTVNLSLAGKRLSFDPQLRFDLDGMRPWSFLFIWNYKIIKKERFQMKLGAYFPAYAFTNLNYTRNSNPVTILTPQRFFIWTTLLNYKLSPKINLSLFYLNGIGLEKIDQSDRGNFISFQIGINNLKLLNNLLVNFNPRLYFLQIDDNQGYYFANTFSLKHKKFPFFLSTTLNQAINTSINANKFDWNIALNYAFKSSYKRN